MIVFGLYDNEKQYYYQFYQSVDFIVKKLTQYHTENQFGLVSCETSPK